jgi:hypothetical protein
MKSLKNMCNITMLMAGTLLFYSCTKLEQKVSSVVPNQNFWNTPGQIAAGIAPAYASLTAIPDGNYHDLSEIPGDDMIVPARGADWLADGQWIQLWQHKWTSTTAQVRDCWGELYAGIGKINFILSIVNTLNPAPANIISINAELKTLRAQYYYWAMDLYGNIPLVTSFQTDASTLTNTPRKDVYNFIDSELNNNLQYLSTDVSQSTYGKVTKYMAFCTLAKLYLNAQTYTGVPQFGKAMQMCDSVILSGKYSLEANYFDNFSINNGGSKENIFVVPFDNINIGGNNWQMQTLHYDNDKNYGIPGGAWNGYCTNSEFYSLYDTSSIYTVKGQNTYRTYNDERAGQFIIGQQYKEMVTYPPNINMLSSSTNPSLKIKDNATGLNLSFYSNFDLISSTDNTFRFAGLRSIKYFPQSGVTYSQSNDMVIYRLADVYLMRAEASLRNGTASAIDLGYINAIRERAYSGDVSHDWKMSDLTLANIYNERGRELAWENFRRQDAIRFGTFGNARSPQKDQDADDHWQIFPIPENQHTANQNLKQNQGYPPF